MRGRTRSLPSLFFFQGEASSLLTARAHARTPRIRLSVCAARLVGKCQDRGETRRHGALRCHPLMALLHPDTPPHLPPGLSPVSWLHRVKGHHVMAVFEIFLFLAQNPVDQPCTIIYPLKVHRCPGNSIISPLLTACFSFSPLLKASTCRMCFLTLKTYFLKKRTADYAAFISMVPLKGLSRTLEEEVIDGFFSFLGSLLTGCRWW